MSSHIMCVSSGGGLPIFTRHKGSGDSLSFSNVASLYGVHMYGKSQGAEILSTATDDYVVAWHEFQESLVLIGISTGCTIEVLSKVLKCAADAIVMIVGLEEIKLQRNIDRLKRELRVCFPIIDRLLDSLDSGNAQSKHSSDLADMVETVLTPENHFIQIVLDSFMECVDSMYACVLIQGKIASATDSWWALDPVELKLLSLLATVENTTTSKDIPVFLPHKNPNAAYRFVACTLIPEVQVLALCGPTPTLEEIERFAAQCFRSSMEMLEAAVKCHPRNFPDSIELDSEILGLLLINVKKGKYMISRNPLPGTNRTASSSNRLDIIRTFYYRAVRDILILINDSSSSDGSASSSSKEDLNKVVGGSVGKETYWCSEFHKCHAMKINDDILCVLYSSGTPTQVLKTTTKAAHKILLKDEKQYCW